MELLKQLNKDNIDFVLIDRLIRSQDGSFSDMLEFTVWERPIDLTITGYKVRHTLEECFEIFDKLSEYDVDSNYMITDLEDEQILAGISCTESIVEKLLGTGQLNKIELKVKPTSIYNILYKSVKANGLVKTEDCVGFGTIRGLHFNESTLDIVWRYKDANHGFKTYTIMQDDMVNDFSLRCTESLGLSCSSIHPVAGGLIEHNFMGSLISSDGFEIYNNGIKLDNLYTIAIVSVELLTNYFARAFESEIRRKVVDALHAHVCEFEHGKYGRSAYKVPREFEKICTIKYPTRMPSTTKLTEFMNSVSYKSDMKSNVNSLLDICSEMYSKDTVDIIRDCLNRYVDVSLIHLMPVTKIDSVTVGNASIENMILANCLKNNFANNDIFRKSHVGKLSRLSSSVFDTSIDIQTYHSQNIMMQQFLQQQGF